MMVGVNGIYRLCVGLIYRREQNSYCSCVTDRE